MKRLLIFFMLAAWLPLAVGAQTVLKGKIVDEKTNQELIGAVVLVEGTTNGTITALDGSFSLKVKPGDFKVEISFLGYIKQSIAISVKDGETKDLETIALKSDAIGLEEVKIVASFAKDRETPVSVSTISPTIIMEKLGSQEFPEILKSTPSVYATKSGGGYGDGRINLRGFDSDNIGVLINGVPVNDMENGKVYWSNWAGLSDVTRSMQVQRGLGASKLALSSVGGTINIITNTTDAEKGGSLLIGIGNDNYKKEKLTLSTGLMENGWAVTASGSRTTGDGYVKGTNFEAYSYFLNISKKITEKQTASFNLIGTQQWHNQRGTRHLIQRYREHPDGIKYNSDIGFRNGKIFTSGYSYNVYTKPLLSLNHYIQINDETSLSTAAYGSFGKGGGRRVYGGKSTMLGFQYPSGEPNDNTALTPDGYLDFDTIINYVNADEIKGSQAVSALAVNSHDWYGLLSTLKTKVSVINITGGLDARYYKGYHYVEIEDLLGGDFYFDGSNVNRNANTPLYKGDKINYYNIGEAAWAGLFAQGEFVSEELSAFVSGTFSNTQYRRIDYFKEYDTSSTQTTDWVPFYNYSIKAGANYNINKMFNVFVNGGNFSRAPFFRYVFLNNTNVTNENAKPEKVVSAEIGAGLRHKLVNANIVGYHTKWQDKALTRSLGNNVVANITGLNALHQGVELEATSNPIKKLEIKAMVSVGNWRWEKDVVADIFDETDSLIAQVNIYAEGLKVGDAAQTTAMLGMDYEILPKIKAGFDVNHYSKLYAQFNIEDRGNVATKGIDSWEMPAYTIVDANIRYKFNMAKMHAVLIANINNIFDTEYISDAIDGASHDAATSAVYYGFGRTWTLSLKLSF